MRTLGSLVVPPIYDSNAASATQLFNPGRTVNSPPISVHASAPGPVSSRAHATNFVRASSSDAQNPILIRDPGMGPDAQIAPNNL